MDTLTGPVIGTECSIQGLSGCRWDSLSPSAVSENDDDERFCRRIKTENPYELDDGYNFRTVSTASSPLLKQSAGSPCTTIPLASCATAAASLSSAFCKRPNGFAKPPASVSCEQTFQDSLNTSNVLANMKTEQPESNQNSYNSSQNSFLAMSSNDCSVTDDAVFGSQPGGNITASAGNNGYNDAAQMDIYRDLILRHLIQDISTTCTKLALPTNPYTWTAEHSGRWISDMCIQFQLHPPRQLFLSGRVLLSMSQEEFLARAPEGGDTLHAQLQLWKTAFESYNLQSNSNTSQTNSNQNQTSTINANNNWLSSQNQNSTRTVERITSAQDYLNSFNPSTADVAPTLNYYTNTNSNYQTAHQDNSVSNSRSQHTFFTGSQTQNNDMLHSPSDSDISSTTSNDGATVERLSENQPTATPQFPRHSGTVHLWHFIRELLDQPKQYSSCVRWVDREEGTFKIESSHHLARFWGERKNRAQMNYDKLSRSLRQYYKKGIIQKPEKKQRLVYKFLPPYNM